MSVREHISRATRTIFTNSFVHVVYGCGSVLFRQGDKIPRGRGQVCGSFFSLTMHCTVEYLGHIQKTAEPIGMPFWMKTRVR